MRQIKLLLFFFISSSLCYINGIQLANFRLLIDRTDLFWGGHHILNAVLFIQGWFSLKKRLILSFKKFFGKTLCWKVFCQLRTDDVRLYWRLYFGSKLSIVSLLCLTCWSTIIVFTFTSWKVFQCLHTDDKRWYWQKSLVQSWLLFVVITILSFPRVLCMMF
jgi:hypothetical protein